MMNSNKRTITILLAAALALSLLLTACGKSGDTASTPAGENTTPGTSQGDDGALGNTNTNEPEQTSPKEENDPDSPYSIAKANVDSGVAFMEQKCEIDVDAVIDGAYVKYGDAINKEIVTPEFAKALMPLIAPAGYGSSDPTGINQQSGTRKARATASLESKGYGDLDMTDATQNIEAAMLFLSAIAEEHNFTVNDRGKIYSVYMCDDANRENYSSAFDEIYYPNLSKTSE